MPHEQPGSWLEFCVRFVFGALLGVCLGFLLVLRGMEAPYAWVVVPACGVIFGVLAGWWGDEFWHGLRHWLWWWP